MSQKLNKSIITIYYSNGEESTTVEEFEIFHEPCSIQWHKVHKWTEYICPEIKYFFDIPKTKKSTTTKRQTKYFIDDKLNFNKAFRTKPLLFQKSNKRIMQMRKKN